MGVSRGLAGVGAADAAVLEDEFAVFALRRRLRRRATPAVAKDSAGADDGALELTPGPIGGGGACEFELSPAPPVPSKDPGLPKALVGIPDAASAASIPDNRELPMAPSRPETRGRR